jgi:predicted nucleic acid-binding protein
LSSALISTESLRTLARLRIRAGFSDIEIAQRRAAILSLIDSLELIEIDSMVLDRAAQPMPTELGTLDAIHLASALLWKDAAGVEPVMATHHGALGLAAQAHGFPVIGT